MSDFNIKDNVLLQYTGKEHQLVIPEVVTDIGAEAFRCSRTIRTVVFPKNLNTIGYRAFEKCRKLIKIKFPANTTINPGQLFWECTRLETVIFPDTVAFRKNILGHHTFFKCTQLTRVELPTGIEAIGVSAFWGCKNLKTLQLPDTVTTIMQSAFQGCSSLADITLSERLTNIKQQAFKGCESLNTLTLPEALTHIGYHAFDNCSSLQFHSYDGGLYLGSATNPWFALIFAADPQCTSLTIHKDTALIADGALCYCQNLKTLTFEGDPPLTAATFYGCTALSTVIAPRMAPKKLQPFDLQRAGAMGYLCYRDAFTEPVIVADWEKYIALQRKPLLERVFAEDLTQALYVYEKAGKITRQTIDEVYLEPAMAANATGCTAFLLNWKENNVSAADIEKDMLRKLNRSPFCVADMKKQWRFQKHAGNTLKITGYIGKETDVEIPPIIGKRPVVAIDNYAFAHTKVVSVVIPEGVTNIANAAFLACNSLQSIAIPDSVTVIGQFSFSWSPSLTIRGKSGSYAEVYAKENNIPFVAE